MKRLDTDVVVVGGGNAGMSAALAVAERARRVIVLESAPKELAGGNSYYTAGATRIVHRGLEDLQDFIEEDERHQISEVPPYSAEDYAADLAKVTNGRNDADLTRVLIAESHATVRWLASKGVRYRLMYERQAYLRADKSYLFWGGLHVGNVGGGVGLVEDETRALRNSGGDIRYGMRVDDFIVDGSQIVGVKGDGFEVRAASVIVAAGGFESNKELRKKYLGPGWENARVRGTPFNDGRLLEAAIALGAARGGDWSTCHSVAWDALAEENESNRELTNRLTRQSYPLGVVVNRDGKRFVDEGADFRNYTYAKYGREILKQPGAMAFQLFDSTVRPMLRTEEYDMPGVSVFVAENLIDLANQAGIAPEALTKTVNEFNQSINRDAPFDPTVKDGRRADVQPPKSNWSSPLETPPYFAYPVTCGITFTFGGLRGDIDGRVLNEDGEPIPGLFAVGEALGGLFSENYPGGTGLAAGMVFGKRAGAVA